jgi:GTPase SAR1 family protein
MELETYNVNQVAKIIVGNKTDKENDRQVSRQEGEQFARKMGTLFIETSAKVNTGVEEAYLELIRKVILIIYIQRLLKILLYGRHLLHQLPFFEKPILRVRVE